MEEIDPQLALADALRMLHSSQFPLATGALATLLSLAQDSSNRKLFVQRADPVLSAVGSKLSDVADTLQQGGQQQAQAARDLEDCVRQACNFLIKLLPQADVGKQLNPTLFKVLFHPVFELYVLAEDNKVR